MKLLKDFETFAVKGNAVDLAVGVVIGAAFGQVTTALANGIITPPISLLIGGVDFTQLVIPIGGGAVIAFGTFLQALVNFVLIALVLFFMVRLFSSITRRRKEEEKKPAENPELKTLMEIRDELRNRRP
ncbi:MAG: large conductance mechanosensitive channel protein MscL [bacterium]|nr:large conductance mechanosensitive channel protein MscL [bacterium]